MGGEGGVVREEGDTHQKEESRLKFQIFLTSQPFKAEMEEI